MIPAVIAMVTAAITGFVATTIGIGAAIAVFIATSLFNVIIGITANHLYDLGNENVEAVESSIYRKLARLFPPDEREDLVREWKSHVDHICVLTRPATRRHRAFLAVFTTVLSTFGTGFHRIPEAARAKRSSFGLVGLPLNWVLAFIWTPAFVAFTVLPFSTLLQIERYWAATTITVVAVILTLGSLVLRHRKSLRGEPRNELARQRRKEQGRGKS